MTDILAAIDDTLADWHGSADSMQWRPEGEADEEVCHFTFEADISRFVAAMTRVQSSILWLGNNMATTLTATQGCFVLTADQPDPRPSVLDARYHQRQRNRRNRRKRR